MGSRPAVPREPFLPDDADSCLESRSPADDASPRRLAERLATEERERARLAQQLHDQLSQHVTALLLAIGLLKGSLEDPEDARQRVQMVESLGDRVLGEIQQLTWQLRRPPLHSECLSTLLHQYGAEWSRRCGVALEFHSHGCDGDGVSPPISAALYRVVQEALANVRRHAGAEHVSLLLDRGEDQLQVVVEDDGRGFDADAVLADPALAQKGLAGIRESLTIVQGTVDVESSPDGGTTLFARIPLGRESGL